MRPAVPSLGVWRWAGLLLALLLLLPFVPGPVAASPGL